MDQLSLRELNERIRNCIEEKFSISFWIVAEISELRVNQRGHCYLELVEKEGDEILAKSRATIWSYAYRNLSGWFESITGDSLRPGIKILANVLVSFHEVFGLSLNIRDIDPKYTIGERAKRRQEILEKLQKDGIAEMNKELPLPLVPQRIAVIASSTSAGYQDFIQQLGSNPFGYRFRIELFQAMMQGKEAERSIIQAMLAVNSNLDEFDLLVIIRGGGATLDLDCFDSYELASHVAQFPLPVVTGIGHERDETITDLVANTKLKTPTAVAEFIISGCRRYDENIEELFVYIADYVKQRLKEEDYLLEDIRQKVRFLVLARVDKYLYGLQQMIEKFNYSVQYKMEQMIGRIDKNENNLLHTIRHLINRQKNLLDHLASKLNLLDPGSILRRGFSITRLKGQVVSNASRLNKDETIETEFYKGKVKSKII